MPPLERLTNIMDHVASGNLTPGHSLGLHTAPGRKEGTVVISGDRLEEGLGFGKNLEAKFRALETALREHLDLPKETAVEAALRAPEEARKLVLPEAALEKLAGLTELRADIIGAAVIKHPAVVEAFREAAVHAVR